MTRTRWVIESGVFVRGGRRPGEPEIDGGLLLAETARATGADVVVLPRVPGGYSKADVPTLRSSDVPVVFYGGLRTAELIRHVTDWYPGAYCHAPGYDCMAYYSAVGDVLFNDDYVVYPAGDIARRLRQDACRNVGRNVGRTGGHPDGPPPMRLFVRPTSGKKPFPGGVVSLDTAAAMRDGGTLPGFGFIPHGTPCVVAPARPVGREWRFVMVAGRVVCGSRYSSAGEEDVALPWPDEAAAMAEAVAVRLSAARCVVDACFTVDIAERPRYTPPDGGRRMHDRVVDPDADLCLMEINSFSCAGLYACDTESVVHHVGREAERAYDAREVF